MSKTFTHDGVEYVAKSHVDEIVRQRIAKYSEKLTSAEAQLSEYQSRLDEASAKIGLVDNLTQQVESLRSELDGANSRYERHTVISQYGITDNGVRDAVEWAYDREMSGRTKKDRQPLSDWLQTIHNEPESAPAVLRPFITAPAASESASAEVAAQQSMPQTQMPPQTQQSLSNTPVPAPVAPASNNGVASGQAVPAPNDLLSRATDPAFYAQNREAIRQAFYSQNGRTDSPYKF